MNGRKELKIFTLYVKENNIIFPSLNKKKYIELIKLWNIKLKIDDYFYMRDNLHPFITQIAIKNKELKKLWDAYLEKVMAFRSSLVSNFF